MIACCCYDHEMVDTSPTFLLKMTLTIWGICGCAGMQNPDKGLTFNVQGGADDGLAACFAVSAGFESQSPDAFGVPDAIPRFVVALWSNLPTPLPAESLQVSFLFLSRFECNKSQGLLQGMVRAHAHMRHVISLLPEAAQADLST